MFQLYFTLTQIKTLLLKSKYFRQQLISLVSRLYLRIGIALASRGMIALESGSNTNYIPI